MDPPLEDQRSGTETGKATPGKEKKWEENRGKRRGEQATGSALQAGRQREAQAGAGAHVAYFGRSRSARPQRRPPTRPRGTGLEGGLHLVCEDLGRREGRPGGSWELGYSEGRQTWARHPLGAVLAGRLGPLGPSPSGAGLGDLANERPFARPRPAPPPEPRPRRVPNRPAPWPGAARARNLRLDAKMPGEQQTEEEEEEEMQEEMVLLVKGEEDEGEEKYEVVKLKIPMDNKEASLACHPSASCLFWLYGSPDLTFGV
uniref:Uncharacterized protein n=1 Tax=Mustela putorius furo TaxID=9669 RepID=M3YLM5_MUSPF